VKYIENSIVFEATEAALYEETRPFMPADVQDDKLSQFCFRLRKCVPPKQATLDLADLGSGTGRIAIPLARHYARFRREFTGPYLKIHCIDLSSAMLSKLQDSWKQIEKECHPFVNIMCHEDDVRKIGRQGPEFDAVIAHWIFHVIEDWRVALYAIDQSIRKTGQLFLVSERSSLYSAIDGDLRDLASSADTVMHDFWRSFLVERTKFDSSSSRRRLGSLVVDDRVERLLNVLGWTDRDSVLSARWKSKRELEWVIDKVILPRSFSNMQLYDDSQKADSEYQQITDRLRNKFSAKLTHKWIFETSFAIEALTRKEIPKLGGDILVDVARATVGRRWERGLGRAKLIGPIWDRLAKSTWARLNGTDEGNPQPLGGLSGVADANVLGIFMSAPTTVGLTDEQRTVSAVNSQAAFWAQAPLLWTDLTGALEMREPFVICVGHSPDEIQRLQSLWGQGCKIHPHLHIIEVGNEAVSHLQNILAQRQDAEQIEDCVHRICAGAELQSRWCISLLSATSKIGVLPYDHEHVGATFLSGVARLIEEKIAILYIFPAAYNSSNNASTRGFLLATKDALDGSTAKTLWSLSDILFSEYEDEMLIREKEEFSTAKNIAPISTDKLHMADTADDLARVRLKAISLLEELNEISMSRHTVVGYYVRFAPPIVEDLRRIARRIETACMKTTSFKENFLLWAPPGQGKTYLVDEIARTTGIDYVKIDLKLPDVTEQIFRQTLSRCQNGPEAHLCLVDEIHARPSEEWQYDVLYGFLDLNELKQLDHGNKVFVLIGSTQPNFEALKNEIVGRKKGSDMLRRVPHQESIPPLEMGDKLVVVLSELRKKAIASNRTVSAVEKLALLYILIDLHKFNAGELADFIAPAIARMPIGDDHLKLRDLFDRDNQEKQFKFWRKEEKTVNNFLYIRD
jgi:SAM-dependent methyltransferase